MVVNAVTKSTAFIDAIKERVVALLFSFAPITTHPEPANILQLSMIEVVVV